MSETFDTIRKLAARRTVLVSQHAMLRMTLRGIGVAEVEVMLVETDSEWSPYYPLADAEKLDEVRSALRRGDPKTASRLGRVYEMTPVAAE